MLKLKYPIKYLLFSILILCSIGASAQKQSNGHYYGDRQNDNGNWRSGGSPNYPSKIEWLLSSSGGVKPF